jgi:hypothetical protein
MLILTAQNVTPGDDRPLARPDGTSDYEVWVGVNHHMIWRGSVNGHSRDAGAAALLRLIAAKMDAMHALGNATNR